MSFLTPLFLLGGLAIALPVIFHLIRRTSKEKTVFSSLMFLQSTPPRLTRRSRLENILLLLLRCLVLVLLALGFARPFFHHVTSGPEANAPPRQVLILVDTSASMRRPEIWEQTRREVDRTLQASSPTDRLALFTFDRQLHPILSFDEWDRTSASERTALALSKFVAVKPGWAAGSLGTALLKAAEVLMDKGSVRDAAEIAREIVLISDLQEGSALDGLQGFEWPPHMKVSIAQVKSKKNTNAALQPVADASELAGDGVKVRVTNSRDASREQFELSWLAGDKTRLATMKIYVPPGQSRVLRAPVLPPTAVADTLLITGDDAEFDNRAYVAALKPAEVPLLYLGNESENDPAAPLYYLKRAFQQTRQEAVRVLPRSAADALSEKDLASARLIIATDVAAENRIPALQRFLQEGKTVFWAVTSPAAAESAARLVPANALKASEARGGGYAMLGQIDFAHPLFASFADPRFSDFTKIHFWKHRALQLDAAGKGRVIAQFDNGDAALVQYSVGQGTLLLLAAGWHPIESQLALSSKFVPFLYALLEMSGGLSRHISQYYVGDKVEIAGAPGTAAKVVKPDGTEIPISGAMRFTQADEPGIYRVGLGQTAARFAVNINPAESRTAAMDLETLQRLGLPLQEAGKHVSINRAARPQHLQELELENRQKVWRWLIVAALMVLMVETWMAARLTRPGSFPAEASV